MLFRSHCGAGLVALLSEDYRGAVAHTRAGLDLSDAAADLETEARCRLMSTLVLIQVGPDLEAGVQNAERAVELLRSSGDALGLAWALVSLAMATPSRIVSTRPGRHTRNSGRFRARLSTPGFGSGRSMRRHGRRRWSVRRSARWYTRIWPWPWRDRKSVV